MIIYGARASNIGNFSIPNTRCAHCDQKEKQDISVFGRYAHIFWIPLFPIGRKAVAECSHCKKTIEKSEFSPELKQRYIESKAMAKRPFWHWIGLGIIVLLISAGSIIGATSETDPRQELLDGDIAQMSGTPSMESDSISFKIKSLFDGLMTEEIEPETFKYRTINKEDRAMILVKIPMLKQIEKEERGTITDMIASIAGTQEDLKDKDLYIGVEGKFSMILIKTPSYEGNSRLAVTSNLFDFYGPKPAPASE